MATSETLQSISYTMYYGNGNDSNGNPKYLGVSVGSLNPSTYDATKMKGLLEGIAGVSKLNFSHGVKTEKTKITY